MFSININSTIGVSTEHEKYAISKIGYLSEVWNRTPVYLVNKKLMDFIFPPEKLKFIDEKCVQRLLKNRSEDLEDYNGLKRFNIKEKQHIRFLKECERHIELEKEIVAVGVFKPNISNIEIMEVEQISGFKIQNRPSIFICPERVENWAKRVYSKVPYKTKIHFLFKLIYTKVLIHELAHAYMHNENYSDKYNSKPFGKIIEESLANAIAVNRLKRYEERSILNTIISSQPLEYRGYVFWIEFEGYQIKEFARAWKEYKPRFNPLMFHRRVKDIYFSELFDMIYFKNDANLFWSKVADLILRDLI